MKAAYQQLGKTKTTGTNHNDRQSSDGARKPGATHRRLYVEATENIAGTKESIFPKRLFEQLSDLHVKCTNPKCRDGGVFLAPMIWEMLQHHETKRLFMEMCPGRVQLPGNKSAWVRCQKMFCIKLLLA